MQVLDSLSHDRLSTSYALPQHTGRICYSGRQIPTHAQGPHFWNQCRPMKALTRQSKTKRRSVYNARHRFGNWNPFTKKRHSIPTVKLTWSSQFHPIAYILFLWGCLYSIFFLLVSRFLICMIPKLVKRRFCLASKSRI